MGPGNPTSDAIGKFTSSPGEAGVTSAGGNWKVAVAPAISDAACIVDETDVAGSLAAIAQDTKTNAEIIVSRRGAR